MSVLRNLFAVGLSVMTAAGNGYAATADPEALDRGGEHAYRRALEPAAADKRLNADPGATTRIRAIANRLVASAPAIEPAARRYPWAVNLVPGPAPDVRVYPGGRMLVTDGLVVKTGFADEEIGAILAHALAHALLGHDARRVAAAMPHDQASPDPNRRMLDAAEATTQTMRTLRYTPAEVAAADRAAAELLARAAYDPRAAGSAWRRLALGKSGILERAPVTEERLVALDSAARAAVALYDETRAKAETQADAPRPPRVTPPAKPGPPLVK